MASQYHTDKPIALSSVDPAGYNAAPRETAYPLPPRPQSGRGSPNARGPFDPRGWKKRVWIAVAVVVVIIAIVVPVVVVTQQKQRNRYPDYTKLSYQLSETYAGEDFFNKFDYFTGYDPTQGTVHYVPQPQAQQLNLTYATPSRAVLRVDTSVGPDSVPDASTGRFSVRITSKTTYDKGLFLFDVRHAPIGCATWPALWLSDPNNWPDNGEIDVMEAMNPPLPGQSTKTDSASNDHEDGNANMMTLHTTKDCTMASVRRKQEGDTLHNTCVNSTNGNAGCGVALPSQLAGGGNSYGADFNARGGGVIALEIRDAGIRLWQFAREGGTLPADVADFASSVAGSSSPSGARQVPDPSTWGTPSADFPNTKCDIGQHFRNQSIIVNVNVCGSALYPKWGASGCPGKTCEAFQAENPTAFDEAYWEFGGFEVYKTV